MMFEVSFRVLGRSLLFLMLTNMIVGCAFIGDRSSEYKSAQDGQALQVPSGLSNARLRERFAIPEIDSKSVPEGQFELPLPPDATATLSDDPYTLKTVDGDAWLEVSMPPSKAWPLIDAFWLDYGLISHTKEVSDGYFGIEELDETSSHQSLIEDLERTSHEPVLIEGMSFQARLTQGIRRNNSELKVRAFFPNATEEEKSTWQENAVTPRIERALLELIGETITSAESGSRYSLNAVNIGDEARIRLLEDEAGFAYLELNLGFRRAWNEVQDALQASPAIISESNRDGGLVYISYLDPEEMESWYTLSSQLEEMRAEKNIELRFYQQGPELIHLRTKMLSDELEPESARMLIELVFEYIS